MEECKVSLSRIMVALDLSAYSESAFLHGLTLAQSLGAELILLNIINSRGLEYMDSLEAQGYGIGRDKYISELEANRREVLEKEYLSRVGDVPTKLIFRVGLPYEQILRAVDKEQADILVMGTKGRTNIAGALFGTTAEKVFRRANCTVVSVRGPEHCRLPESA
jgi:nucleotide-binding universal stress UspA family protein